MKHFFVNIEQNTVTVDGGTCNFVEAGLGLNDGTNDVLTDVDEIAEALEETEGVPIRVTFV